MSFRNPFSSPNSPTNPQKLSLQYIEQAYFHRIQIKSLSCLYKLNVKIKKPIILSLHTLQVLKYIIDHSDIINSILNMENIYEIRLSVPGYGVFNQKYQLERLSGLFGTLERHCKNVSVTVKKIALELPGWRTFSNEVIHSIFQFVKKCSQTEEFSLNLNHIMDLSNSNSSAKQEETENEDETLYGINSFKTDQFQFLMKSISMQLPAGTLNRLQLRFGAWESVSSDVVKTLAKYLGEICDKFQSLKIVKLDLNGWGTGKYQLAKQEIGPQIVEQLFKFIEDFDGQRFELLEFDMRNWPNKYKIGKFKERFQHLCGGKRKEDMTGSENMWNMTGTNFMGSQLKSKIMGGRMKVQIKD